MHALVSWKTISFLSNIVYKKIQYLHEQMLPKPRTQFKNKITQNCSTWVKPAYKNFWKIALKTVATEVCHVKLGKMYEVIIFNVFLEDIIANLTSI